MVGCDLCCCRSVDSLFSEMVFDLFTARTGSLQIFLRVAADFRLSMLAALQVVAQLSETQCQLGSVDGRGVALGPEHLVRLQSSHLFPIFGAVPPPGHIDDHPMAINLLPPVALHAPP